MGVQLPGGAGQFKAGLLGAWSLLADSTTGSASSATPCEAAGRCPVARRLQCACKKHYIFSPRSAHHCFMETSADPTGFETAWCAVMIKLDIDIFFLLSHG